MNDRRRYPKNPGLPITAAWKALVRAKLAENEAADVAPRNPTELAGLVHADKSGLIRMLSTPQRTYKYALKICALLGLDEPLIERSVSDDEWGEMVSYVRSLPRERQRQALAVLRAHVGRVDV